MAKGFSKAVVINRDLEAIKAQEALDLILKEKAEAEARRNLKKKIRADIEDGINVLMIMPSFSETSSSFMRLTLFHYSPFSHVCPRPAPIFDPNDKNTIIFSKAYQSGPDSAHQFRCQQCINGWDVVNSYIKDNGLKGLKEVSYNVKESKFYSASKPSVQAVFAAVNVSCFFTLPTGKTFPTINAELYKKWYDVFMDVVIGAVEAPEDMPDKMKLQAEAGLQVMRVNQVLAKDIRIAVDSRAEEMELSNPNEDGTPVNPLAHPDKFLVAINRTSDPTSVFQTADGEKTGFNYTVNCFPVLKASGWTVPDSFMDFIEENPIDIYDIKPTDDSLEAKATAYQELTEQETIDLCLKYGVDIVNGVHVSKAVRADGSNGGEGGKGLDFGSKLSKPSEPVADNFDDSDDDDDDLAVLAAAKKKAVSGAKPASVKK